MSAYEQYGPGFFFVICSVQVEQSGNYLLRMRDIKMKDEMKEPEFEENKLAIIDMEKANISMGPNTDAALKMLKLLADSIGADELLFREAYKKNDIKATRELFHKIKGGLNYCGVPRLQNIVNKLHDEVKKVSDLSELQPMYEEFYMEIQNFLHEYAKIKKD